MIEPHDIKPGMTIWAARVFDESTTPYPYRVVSMQYADGHYGLLESCIIQDVDADSIRFNREAEIYLSQFRYLHSNELDAVKQQLKDAEQEMFMASMMVDSAQRSIDRAKQRIEELSGQ